MVVTLMIIPLYLKSGADFTGTDTKATEMIQQIKPAYQPWYQPLWQPPSGETESLLLAVQAALGAGFLGYYIGFKKGQKAAKS